MIKTLETSSLAATRVVGRYDDEAAVLTLSVPGTKFLATFDESEVDAMLRVLEYSHSVEDALADLADLFRDEFGCWAGRVAEHINRNYVTLYELVYDVTP